MTLGRTWVILVREYGGEYRTAGIDECDLVRCLLCDIEPYLGYTVREYGVNIELQVLMSATW